MVGPHSYYIHVLIGMIRKSYDAEELWVRNSVVNELNHADTEA